MAAPTCTPPPASTTARPALGRFLSRDPLNRVPLFFSEQPYAYAGNNPLIHVDPSGQMLSPCVVGCGGTTPPPPPPPGGGAGSGGSGGSGGDSGSGSTLSTLLRCSPTDRDCLTTAITNKLLSLIAAANFAVELGTTLVAFGFLLTDISQLADGDILAFVNFVGDASTTLSGLVAVMKDGALIFGWGGDTFQDVLALLTAGAKAFSAAANLARGIMGGLVWLSMVGNPMGLAKEALKRLMSQIIKAIIGGFGFALTDSINGGVAAVQYQLLKLKDTPTKQLPAICKFWGAQC